jgi:hypothetical protein
VPRCAGKRSHTLSLTHTLALSPSLPLVGDSTSRCKPESYTSGKPYTKPEPVLRLTGTLLESERCLTRVYRLVSSCHAGFAVQIRHFWSGNEPGLTKLVSPSYLIWCGLSLISLLATFFYLRSTGGKVDILYHFRLDGPCAQRRHLTQGSGLQGQLT